MNHLLKNQKGASHLILIGVVVVVAVVGIASFRVLTHSSKQTANNTPLQPVVSVPNTIANTADASQASKALDAEQIDTNLDGSQLDSDINSML